MKTADTLNTSKVAVKRAIMEVEWQDLRQLSRFQIAYNLLLPYPFLLLSWWFVSQSRYFFALAVTYLFFAAAFRQAHDGYHRSLGVSKRTTTLLIIMMSMLLITGLHSIRATHMQHHQNPLADDDIEGSLAKLTWWQALLHGARYRLMLYKVGLRLSNTRYTKIAWLEFGWIGVIILSVVMLLLLGGPHLDTLKQIASYHLIVMILANASVGMIAVWSVHHNIEDTIARTERNPIINLLTFGLLFHVEHHYFPAVPTCHLPKLAMRLDDYAPQLTKNRVIPMTRVLDKTVQHLPYRFSMVNRATNSTKVRTMEIEHEGKRDIKRKIKSDCPTYKRLA